MNGLYNGMIYPLIPMSIKGVAWYQGESNNDDPVLYKDILANMIKDWRKNFGEGDLPFLIVQITPQKYMPPQLRESQFLVYKEMKNTALIVTTDIGDVHIHSPHKQPVGKRLMLAALALAYGQKITYSGPVYQSYSIKGNKIVLHFTHTNGKLVSKGGKLTGFTIAGTDKKFVPANAKIKGTEVVVYSRMAKKPVAARYGWANVPVCNLVNSAGLPASPFRTDVNR
jgi:sialate O-acetylesterase